MEVLLVFVVPTAAFGLFALLAVWFGAESRPWFDERPVLDDRPNWGPIAGRPVREDAEDEREPGGGEPQPVASATRTPTSPAGVWSPASSAAS
jgi:hypothetical protein